MLEFKSVDKSLNSILVHIHRAIAIVCLTYLALIQTLPFTPVAESREKCDLRRGRRK
jgi:hypothetical protein